jgi:hypothetical protein
MPAHPEHIERLTSTPTEMEAGIIVAALEEEGIKSTMTGVNTAEFRVAVPEWVEVLVAREDLARANAVLDRLREDRADIDWDTIDVGPPEDE